MKTLLRSLEFTDVHRLEYDEPILHVFVQSHQWKRLSNDSVLNFFFFFFF